MCEFDLVEYEDQDYDPAMEGEEEPDWDVDDALPDDDDFFMDSDDIREIDFRELTGEGRYDGTF